MNPSTFTLPEETQLLLINKGQSMAIAAMLRAPVIVDDCRGCGRELPVGTLRYCGELCAEQAEGPDEPDEDDEPWDREEDVTCE